MKFVTSLSVERTHGEANPFWPHGVKRLVVVVSRFDDRDERLVAYGVDPVHHHVVFHAELPAARLSDFIKAVLDGDKEVIHHHRTAIGEAVRPLYSDTREAIAIGATEAGEVIVVVSYRDPADPGPRVALAFAAAIRSQESLAEAVASQHAPKPDPRC
jgi:hypothetical protein